MSNDKCAGAPLYRAGQVRELDRRAIQEFWIPGATLMARAGKAAFDALRRRWPKAKRIAVVAGVGNNAGDGYVVARLAAEAGLKVKVLQAAESDRAGGDAAAALTMLEQQGVKPQPFAAEELGNAQVIVDALLGTGLKGEVRSPFREAIEAMEAASAPVLSLDLPSGLCADTGRPLGCAVHADLSVGFIGLKQGMFNAEGPDYCGEIEFSDLQVPPEVYLPIQPSARVLGYRALAGLLKPRPRTAHKGDFGHVLVVGGTPGFAGAVRMAGEAAARVGAGLVSVATHWYHAAAVSGARPELMAHPMDSRDDLGSLLERADVVVLGPGLGQEVWSQGLWEASLESRRALVVDADGLNLLADHPDQRDDWVLTPHPGEAGRLLGVSTEEIQKDRFGAVLEIQRRYGGVCILKGAGTLVAGGNQPSGICPEGNPGMAGGGMGDILSGLVGGLMAQGLPPLEAARLGVCLHARAADRAAAEGGERGMLASDLLPLVRGLANPESAYRHII
jgi:hydroxyethylthiazole kinase-like uncharacterized protein yjeF